MNKLLIARELLNVAKLFLAEKQLRKEEKDRQTKKVNGVKTLAENIQKLRSQVTKDMKSDDEKLQLKALVVALMDKTSERVGNEESAKEDHVGITGLKKKHVKVEGNKIYLEYTGKSSVEHKKEFTNENIATVLKKFLDRCKDKEDFVMKTGEFKVKADAINRYLDEFEITAKDIRGYSANRLIIDALNRAKPLKEEKDRKTRFLELARNVAEKVGHGLGMLRKYYLLPNLEKKYVEDGEILNLKEL